MQTVSKLNKVFIHVIKLVNSQVIVSHVFLRMLGGKGNDYNLL